MGKTNPIPQFTHFVSTLKERHPKLAYIHVVEAVTSEDDNASADADKSNDFLRAIWQPLPYISVGGYITREKAMKPADEKGDIVACARMYVLTSVFRNECHER